MRCQKQPNMPMHCLGSPDDLQTRNQLPLKDLCNHHDHLGDWVITFQALLVDRVPYGIVLRIKRILVVSFLLRCYSSVCFVYLSYLGPTARFLLFLSSL